MEGLYLRWTFTWKSQSILVYIGCSCGLETSHHKSRCPNPVGIIHHIYPSTTVSLQSSKCEDIVSYFILQFGGNLHFGRRTNQFVNTKILMLKIQVLLNSWILGGSMDLIVETFPWVVSESWISATGAFILLFLAVIFLCCVQKVFLWPDHWNMIVREFDFVN